LPVPNTFNKDNFHQLCNQLTKQDAELKHIIHTHGYPPLWSREPGFETLVHIILEQQVSLASAKAALLKLKEKIGVITPKKVLALTDAALKACYFSRQKTVYARHLANAILSGELDLKKLNTHHDDIIREQLKRIKGIGDWTVDVYLLMGLQRTDIFPIGDLAMVNSLKRVKQLPHPVTKEQLLQLAESWRPYRSIASMLLWHHYIEEKRIKS
jgi:DNA-3-methyladenine glycosylase II